jgi:hypothetical protein
MSGRKVNLPGLLAGVLKVWGKRAAGRHRVKRIPGEDALPPSWRPNRQLLRRRFSDDVALRSPAEH